MKLSTLIRKTRQRAGMSTSALAERAGVSKSFLCRIERGSHARIGHRTLERIARELELPLDDVFAAAGKLPPEVERFVLANLGRVRRAMARAA